MMSPEAFDGRLYFVVPKTSVADIDFSQVLESSMSTMRYNSDGTKGFVCYESPTVPSSLAAISDKEGPYTNEEALSMLNTAEWQVTTENLPSEPDDFLD